MAFDGVSVDAPAKINLALHVVGQRDDGYHLLESLSVFTAFGDRILIRDAEQDSLAVTGPFAPHVPKTADNLVIRARDAMRIAIPALAAPVSIELEKNIPVQSGVGGGSSDAAATMMALARLRGVAASADDFACIGLPLGADLPMCIHARPLTARGIGDRIELIRDFPAFSMVLVNPGVAVPTPRVFALLKRRENPPLPPLDGPVTFAGLTGWLGQARNDLSAPALEIAPTIGGVIDALTQTGAVFARMSGSGATCYGLFADDTTARDAATTIASHQPGWFVVATSTIPSVPSPEGQS